MNVMRGEGVWCGVMWSHIIMIHLGEVVTCVTVKMNNMPRSRKGETGRHSSTYILLGHSTLEGWITKYAISYYDT